MGKANAMVRPRVANAPMDPAVVLGALASAVVAVDGNDIVLYVNGAAEQLFQSGTAYLCGRPVTDLLPPDSPILSLIAQARGDGLVVSEYGISLIPRAPATAPSPCRRRPSPKHRAMWC